MHLARMTRQAAWYYRSRQRPFSFSRFEWGVLLRPGVGAPGRFISEASGASMLLKTIQSFLCIGEDTTRGPPVASGTGWIFWAGFSQPGLARPRGPAAGRIHRRRRPAPTPRPRERCARLHLRMTCCQPKLSGTTMREWESRYVAGSDTAEHPSSRLVPGETPSAALVER